MRPILGDRIHGGVSTTAPKAIAVPLCATLKGAAPQQPPCANGAGRNRHKPLAHWGPAGFGARAGQRCRHWRGVGGCGTPPARGTGLPSAPGVVRLEAYCAMVMHEAEPRSLATLRRGRWPAGRFVSAPSLSAPPACGRLQRWRADGEARICQPPRGYIRIWSPLSESRCSGPSNSLGKGVSRLASSIGGVTRMFVPVPAQSTTGCIYDVRRAPSGRDCVTPASNTR